MAKTLRDPNRRPSHLGEILREDVLPALGLTQKGFADHLGVSCLTVSDILHEKRGNSRYGDSPRQTTRQWPRDLAAHATGRDIWTLEQRKGHDHIGRLKAA